MALDAELRAFEASFPLVYHLPIDSTGRIRFANPPSLTEMRAALLHLCLAAEFVRLHRPFLGKLALIFLSPAPVLTDSSHPVLAATDDIYQHSREQCVKYAKRLLAINAIPGCKLNWAGCEKLPLLFLSIVLTPNHRNRHTFKVLLGAISLAIELLQSPGEPDAPMIRSALNGVLDQVEGSTAASVRFENSCPRRLDR